MTKLCRTSGKRYWALALLLCLGWLPGGIQAASDDDDELPPVELLEARDFAALAGSGELDRRPLLLAFVADYCHFCKTIEEEYLKPMLRNRDYDDKVVIRLFRLDTPEPVTDFDGKQVAVDEFAARYGAKLTPTVVFLDGKGREAAPKIVGVTNIEYYGGFLDDGIDNALGKIPPRHR